MGESAEKYPATNMPHEIVAHWLVEQVVPGQQSMKMLRLRPLDPPGASTLEVPYVETTHLQARFRDVWEAYHCDAEPPDLIGCTGRTAANAAIY